ncbi:TolC family protein [Myxacorys almedinensis]|uniref:TolC family protein n=1 Tax=Myxacorys almedinensis A TaxID=2690445 RepID=A0A8J8CNF5_9CYAN|nr:TolC family protein [Myxacorys almedinensis]NDJ19520.1 TolC family protein [Myxacorys almedinensis A]
MANRTCMKPCLHFLAVGVGALILLGHTDSSNAKPASSRTSQSDPEPPIPSLTPLLKKPNPLPQTSGVSHVEPPPNRPLQTSRLVPISTSAQTLISSPSALPHQTTLVPPAVVSQTVIQTSPLAQTTPRPPAGSPTPTPSNDVPAIAPTLTPSVPTPSRSVPAPQRLNPSANPLQFPTQPSEVQIQASESITLLQALELAERNNRDVEISQLELERAQAALREARAANLPTLGLSAGLSRSGSNVGGGQGSSRQLSQLLESLTGQPSDDDNDSSVSTSLSSSLRLSYDLYTSGLRNANLRASERQVRAAELALERIREQLRLDTTGDYYDLQDADEQSRINQAAVANAQANLNDSIAQESAGLGTRFDVLRAQVNLANAQQQLTNAQANQVVRRRQLAQRLSLPEYATVQAADSVEVAGSWTPSLEESIILAYKNRSELEEQLVQIDISEQQRRAVLAANGPTLSVSADYGFSQGLGGNASISDNYAFALQAQWNLFDGGATIARARQQEKNKQIAQSRFAQNRNSVRFQVEQAYTNLQANLVNIATTEQAVTQALEALRLAVLRLQAGVGTQTERINAETDLTRARGNRVSAIIGYNRSLAQLRRSVSNLAR